MTIIGVASVKIKPDLSEFRRELKTELSAIKAEISVKVKADIDPARRTIEEFVAKQELKDINKKVDIDKPSIRTAEQSMLGLANSALKVGQGFLSASLRIIRIGVVASAASAALVGAVHVVGALSQAIAALAPAGLAVGLGGVLALGAAFATVQLGMGGIGRALDALNAPIHKLRDNLEATFQKSFTPAVKNLVPVIPKLQGPLKAIADEAGKVATQFTKMVSTKENIGLLQNILSNSAQSVKGLGAAVTPLAQAFLRVGEVATKVFVSITQGAGKAAQEFSDKIVAKAASGELEASFKKSIANVKEFFGIIKTVGVGIGNIFRSFTGSLTGGSGSFLDTLSQMADKFRSFTAQEGTKQFFTTLGDVVHILSGAFHALFDAIKPVLPVLADTAKVIADQLSDVIKGLGPHIAEVATHLLDIVKQVAPKLLPVIGKIADAFLNILDACLPLIGPITDLVVALVPIIDPIVQLVKTLVPPLVQLLGDLLPIVEFLAKAFAGLADALGPVVGSLLTFAAAGIGAITDLLGLTDGNKITSAEGVTHGLGERLGKSLAQGLEDGSVTGGSVAVKRFGDTINALLANNGPQLNAIGRAVGQAGADGVSNGILSAQARINEIMNGILANLGIRVTGFNAQGQAMGRAFTDGLTSQERAAIAEMQHIIDGILGVLNGSHSRQQAEGAAISKSFADGIASGSGAVSNSASTLTRAAAAAVSGFSLFSTGASIGGSLASGIQSSVGGIKKILNDITASIPQWKGPPAKDRVLLKPTGQLIMQGLIDGISSQQDDLQRVLGSVTDQFTSATDSGSLAGSLSSSLLVAGDLAQPAVNVNVGLNEGALKGIIDVQIDDSSRLTRRNALSGGVNF